MMAENKLQSFRLSKLDEKCIQIIMQDYGCHTKIGAIRMALNSLSYQVKYDKVKKINNNI